MDFKDNIQEDIPEHPTTGYVLNELEKAPYEQ